MPSVEWPPWCINTLSRCSFLRWGTPYHAGIPNLTSSSVQLVFSEPFLRQPPTSKSTYIRLTDAMSRSARKPTVLLVHGAWQNASCWDSTRAALKKLSFPRRGGAVEELRQYRDHASRGRRCCSQGIGVLDRVGRQDRHPSHALIRGIAGDTRGARAGSRCPSRGRARRGASSIAAFLVSRGKSLIGMFDEAPAYLFPDVSHSILPRLFKEFRCIG